MDRLEISNTTPYNLIGFELPRTMDFEKIKLRQTSYETALGNLPNIPVKVVEVAKKELQEEDTVTSEEDREEKSLDSNITLIAFPREVYAGSYKALKVKGTKIDAIMHGVGFELPPRIENTIVSEEGQKTETEVKETEEETVEQNDSTGLYGTMSLDGLLSIEKYDNEVATPVDASVPTEEVPTVTPEVVSSESVEEKVEPKEEISQNDVQEEVNEEFSQEEIPTEDIAEEFKDVSKVYQFCEAVDEQRAKTEEATKKAREVVQDFTEYKEKSQREIEDSNRRLQEAGDGQTEAEQRYRTAEQLNQDALRNLINTGKRQQEVLRNRQREAETQIIDITEQRTKLENENTKLLADNKEQTEKYLMRTEELDSQTQLKNDEAAKWDAIAKAMEDPEEDFMGFINFENDSEYEEEHSYGRRAA